MSQESSSMFFQVFERQAWVKVKAIILSPLNGRSPISALDSVQMSDYCCRWIRALAEHKQALCISERERISTHTCYFQKHTDLLGWNIVVLMCPMPLFKVHHQHSPWNTRFFLINILMNLITRFNVIFFSWYTHTFAWGCLQEAMPQLSHKNDFHIPHPNYSEGPAQDAYKTLL